MPENYELADYELIEKIKSSQMVKCTACKKKFPTSELEWLPECFLDVLRVNTHCPYCSRADVLEPM